MLGALFRDLIRPFVRVLASPFIHFRVHPNLVTLLGIPLALACAWALATQQWLLALILIPLSALPDLLDGTVARALKKQSLWGNYFETMVDKLIEIIIFIGLAFVAPIPAIAALGFGLWSSYAKPRVALVIITDNRDWPAMGEHADKLVMLFIGTLLATLYPANAILIIETVLLAIAAITFVGTLQRMQYAQHLIREAEKAGAILPYLKKGRER